MTNKSTSDEFWTSERCYVTELMNNDRSPEVSIAKIRVEAGVTTQLHSLEVAEWYVVESGSGIMTVGEQTPSAVGNGDVVCIPKGIAQQIENTGTDDLVFLCVCTPRFHPEHYTALE